MSHINFWWSDVKFRLRGVSLQFKVRVGLSNTYKVYILSNNKKNLRIISYSIYDNAYINKMSITWINPIGIVTRKLRLNSMVVILLELFSIVILYGYDSTKVVFYDYDSQNLSNWTNMYTYMFKETRYNKTFRHMYGYLKEGSQTISIYSFY